MNIEKDYSKVKSIIKLNRATGLPLERNRTQVNTQTGINRIDNMSQGERDFLKKLNIIKQIYDYSAGNKDVKLKSDRIAVINELIELLNDQNAVTSLFIPHIEILMEMISKNIFRPKPSLNNGFRADNDENDTNIPGECLIWPHIKGVYDIFNLFIINEALEIKALKVYITNDFVTNVNISVIFSSYSSLTQKNHKKEIYLKIYYINCMRK
jgi:hypothetical protein